MRSLIEPLPLAQLKKRFHQLKFGGANLLPVVCSFLMIQGRKDFLRSLIPFNTNPHKCRSPVID